MKKENFAVLTLILYIGTTHILGCSPLVPSMSVSVTEDQDQGSGPAEVTPVNSPCQQVGFAVKHAGHFSTEETPCPPGSGNVITPTAKPIMSPVPAAGTTIFASPKPLPTTAPVVSPAFNGIPAIFKKIYGASAISLEGNYVVIKSNGRPEHKSPYYKNTIWESTLYEAYNGTGTFIANPSKIAEYELGLKIPVNPVAASTHSKTQLGPMGIAVNGVAFYNQYAAGYTPLGNEKVSFDQYNGHPQQEDHYHYHTEPLALTAELGKDALLGFLLDGFPVYGPEENGKTITNSELDVYHGHFGVTADYPQGVYHYHITSEAPYINGGTYYGTPGIVLR
jgi:hypothetical protein